MSHQTQHLSVKESLERIQSLVTAPHWSPDRKETIHELCERMLVRIKKLEDRGIELEPKCPHCGKETW